MKNKIILAIFLLTLCFMSMNSVHAEENNIFFVNNNGVSFSEKMYNNFLKVGFNEDEIVNMTQEVYNTYKDMDNVYLEKEVSKFFRETTITRLGQTNTVIEEITEDEYENEMPSNASISTYVSHETTYKKIEMTSFNIGNGLVNDNKMINVVLKWKEVPKIKSYDIIAARATNGEIITDSYVGSFTSTETKFDSDCQVRPNDQFADYTKNFPLTYNGWNVQNGLIGKKGVGLTAQLSTGGAAICQYDLGLNISVPVGYRSDLHFIVPKGTTVYGTYQHASKTVSFDSVRKAYTFDSKGLGKVVYFSNSNLTNSYDAMGGVSFTV